MPAMAEQPEPEADQPDEAPESHEMFARTRQEGERRLHRSQYASAPLGELDLSLTMDDIRSVRLLRGHQAEPLLIRAGAASTASPRTATRTSSRSPSACAHVRRSS